MACKNAYCYIMIFISVLIPFVQSSAYDVCGSASIKLSSPATKKQQKMVREKASDSLSTSLYFWMQRENLDLPDLSDSIVNSFFIKFRSSCIKQSKPESFFEGKEWSLNFCLPSEEVKSVFSEHNNYYDSAAIHYWKLGLKHEKNNNDFDCLKAFLNSIYYSMGRLGSQLSISGDTNSLKNALTEKTQSLINKISITSDPPFIKGKPSYLMSNKVLVTVRIDTTPIAGLPLICTAGGRKIFSLSTNSDGKVYISKLKIPFVPNGSFLHVLIDLSRLISEPVDITLNNLGLDGTEETDQTLIFSISEPAYTLDYSINSASKIKVPESFSKSDNLEKYLKNKLHMNKTADNGTKDIAISIQSQVSGYEFDERERIEIKIDTKLDIIKFGSPKNRITETRTINKKEYDSKESLLLGEFFWQAHNNLIEMIKEHLELL